MVTGQSDCIESHCSELLVASDDADVPPATATVEPLSLQQLASQVRALAQQRFDPTDGVRTMVMLTFTSGSDGACFDAAVWVQPDAPPLTRSSATACDAFVRLLEALRAG